jgi:hypothetical protein
MKKIEIDEIARIRNKIIADFSDLENAICMIIYDYYKTRSDLQCFVEDFFLT